MNTWDKLLKTLADYGNLQLQYTEGVSYSYDQEEITFSCKTGEDIGGNCWNGVATYQGFHIQPQEFTMLDFLLLEIEPDLKLRDYRTIKNLVHFEETSYREEYNNGRYYNNYSISKENLINVLNELKILPSNTQLEKIEDKLASLYLASLEPAQTIKSRNRYN